MNDNYVIPLVLFGSLILLMFVFVIASFIIIQKQKQERAFIEKRETEQRYENELLHVRLEVQEHSLNLVSREIHDNIGQVLSIIRMQLFNASRAESLESAHKQISSSTDMLGSAINDLRNLSHVLNGEMINRLGVVASIEKELAFVNTVYPVKGKLEISGDEINLSPERELLLFRIVQQAVGNIYKHANATTFEIVLEYEEKKMTLKISDDGSGFNEEQLTQATGIGLMNIRERAKMLGGEVSFGNNKDQGAYVLLILNIE